MLYFHGTRETLEFSALFAFPCHSYFTRSRRKISIALTSAVHNTGAAIRVNKGIVSRFVPHLSICPLH